MKENEKLKILDRSQAAEKKEKKREKRAERRARKAAKAAKVAAEAAKEAATHENGSTDERNADGENADDKDAGDENDQEFGPETNQSRSWASLVLSGEDDDVDDLGDEFVAKNVLTERDLLLPYQKEAVEAMDVDKK